MSDVSHRGLSGASLPPSDSVREELDALDARLTAAEADIADLQAGGGGGGGAGTTYTLVTSLGVSANSSADQRAAIQAAIDTCVSTGIKRLHFPKGTYYVDRTTFSGVGICLLFSGINGLQITGDGPDSTIIRMFVDFSTTVSLGRRMLYFKDSSQLVFRDLTLSGGWTNGTTGHDEQIHLTEINSTNAESADIYFDNVWFRDCYGDGFRTVGKDQTTFSTNTGTDVVTHYNGAHTTPVAHGFSTGDGPYYAYTTATSTLPGGLQESVPYWIIRVTNTTFKLATSAANAAANTAIDLTTTGTEFVWTLVLWAQRCHVLDCRFVNVKRAPISGQRASRACTVSRSYIESVTDSAIDFEPSGTLPQLWDISHNVIVHKAPTVDIVVSFLASNSRLSFNRILGGVLDVKSAVGSAVLNNYIESRDDSNGTIATIRVTLCTDTVLTNNTAVRPLHAAAAPVCLLGTDASLGNDGVLLTGNTFNQYTTGDVAQISSSANCRFQGNNLNNYGASSTRGIFGTSTVLAVPLENLVIKDNVFTGNRGGSVFTRAVFINSNAGTVGNTTVVGNTGTGITSGVEYAGGLSAPGFTKQPICHDNTWTVGTSNVVITPTVGLEAVVVGKTGSQFRYEGAGSPEGVVTAAIGAQYFRTDGTAGTLLYQKDTGSGNTGWVAKL